MSSPPPSPTHSSTSSEDDERDRFGKLLDIEPAALITLATKILRDVDPAVPVALSEVRLIDRCSGSFNLVHIFELDAEHKVVVRLPVSGRDGALSDVERRALASQVATMRYLRANTALPVPEVYAFDAGIENEIGAPYMAMEYVPGVSVSMVWFDDAEGRREEKRLRILKQLAELSAQMRELRFDSIGSLSGEETATPTIGECFNGIQPDDDDPDSFEVISYGPFTTAQSWLQHLRDAIPPSTRAPNAYDRATTKILDLLLPSLPFLHEERCFSLTMPDFGLQNVMVDEDGNVTALIDWDYAQTRPSYLAFARYPSWLTRDWDPLMYGWPHVPEREDSPEELGRYRKHYLAELKAALAGTPDADAYKLTERAHIFEAVYITLECPPNATAICQKFIKEATAVVKGQGIEGLDQDEIGVLLDLGDDELSEAAWEALQKGMKMLMGV
ncbi:hypothetical protein MKEN_01468900 [Mycena kentingensis (nom. inval.)]|nr:hypothetical protein MKEN_01468900 [Mycena kentingensis (nom. inval.)]